MGIRIQFGNVRGANAYSVSNVNDCTLFQIGAFHEHFSLASVFYGKVIEGMATNAKNTWVEIPSYDRWWGGRKKDLRLVSAAPILSTDAHLLFDATAPDRLWALLENFWVRAPLRIYGGDNVASAHELLSLMQLERSLQAYCRFLPLPLRFIAEKHPFRFFLRLFIIRADLPFVNELVLDCARVLNSPLLMDRNAFAEFE